MYPEKEKLVPHEQMFEEYLWLKKQPWLTSWFLMNNCKEEILSIGHLTKKLNPSSLFVQANRCKQLKWSRNGSFSAELEEEKRQQQSSEPGRENVLQPGPQRPAPISV